MGCGIWSMHFIGMMAFSLPIPITYDFAPTLWSMVISDTGIGICAVHDRAAPLTLTRLLTSGVLMGIGIAAMHYTGMAGRLQMSTADTL